MGMQVMNSVLSFDDINVERRPNFKISQLWEETFTDNQVKEEDVLTIEEDTFSKGSYALINAYDLSKNQDFFLEQSIKKLNESIVLEKEYLISENVELPTETVINKSIRLLELLAYKNLLPNKISTSIEEGVCMTFNSIDKIMYLELYNDDDMGYIIENKENKNIIKNEDLSSLSKCIEILEEYYS